MASRLRNHLRSNDASPGVGFYTPGQIESGLQFVFGPDTRLIDDRTYFVIHSTDGLAAAGGWSRRRTLYGGDQFQRGAAPLLDPAATLPGVPLYLALGVTEAERIDATLPDGTTLPIVRMVRPIAG